MCPRFNIAELEQASLAWRTRGHQGIGASDAAVIMVESGFSSAAALLQEKRQAPRDKGQNPAMAIVANLEPEARGAGHEREYALIYRRPPLEMDDSEF